MLHNRVMVRWLLILAALSSFFLFAAEASAQSLTAGVNPVQYIVTPEAPRPGDTVLIEVQGIGTFLGDATITWQQDGKTVKSGTGESSFSFIAGALGSKTSIKVTINSATQGTITKTFTFSPSSVNMLWEANTSVPWWFKGKPLYTAGSTLTITALPQIVSGGKTLSANALSFQWKINDTPVPQSSGVGKNRIIFAGSQLLPGETATVDVYYAGALVGRGSITVPASKPQVMLYVRDPLRGTLSDQALQNSISLTSTEFTLEAVPFYFANESISRGTAPFVWTLNGDETTGPQTAQGLLTLRQSGSGAGRAQVEVDMQNTDSDKYVQSAQNALTILFGGASNSAFSSFFGL
jgi:hypothetical protein